MKKKFNEHQNHGPQSTPNQKHHESIRDSHHGKPPGHGINKVAMHRRLENRRSGKH